MSEDHVRPSPHPFLGLSSARLSVVVVTHNSQAVVEACLAALAANLDGMPVEVIVVDNASTDRTREIVGAHACAALVANPVNVGFAAACNIGIRMSTGREVLLLNPDAIVTAGAVARLVGGLQRFAEAGLAGPTLESADQSMRPAAVARASLAAKPGQAGDRRLPDRRLSLDPAHGARRDRRARRRVLPLLGGHGVCAARPRPWMEAAVGV